MPENTTDITFQQIALTQLNDSHLYKEITFNHPIGIPSLKERESLNATTCLF